VDIDDQILYAIYPVTGKKFLKWKYGHEEPPEEVRAKTLEEANAERELVKKALAGELVEKTQKEVPQKGEALRTFNVFVDNEYYEVGVEEPGGSPVVSYVQPMPASTPPPVPSPVAQPPAPATPPPAPEPSAAAPVAEKPAMRVPAEHPSWPPCLV